MKNVLVCLLLGMSVAQAAEPALTVAWRENPPYHYTDNGKEKGFLLARGKRIFDMAGVPATFTVEPTKRIWAKFQSNTPSYCSLGRYYLAERADIMQYSLPIHFDPPRIVLVSSNAIAKVRLHSTLTSMLGDPSLILGMSDGGSFGPQIDERLAHASTKVERRTVESPIMMKLLEAGRVHFVFADQYAWRAMRKNDESLKGIVSHTFPDMPPGMSRYLVCSKDVPTATMQKLNNAIKRLHISNKLMTDEELDL